MKYDSVNEKQIISYCSVQQGFLVVLGADENADKKVGK
jgi:hypothetical protein